MSAIRHGREVLPATVRPLPPGLRFRCGWCTYVGTREDVDAHADREHAEHLVPLPDPASA